MSSFFFLLLLLVSGGTLTWLLIAGLNRSLKRLVFRELRRERHQPWRVVGARAKLTWACAGALIVGILLAWGFFGRPIYGLGALFLAPWLLSRVLPWWHRRRSRALDESALSYLHALHGLTRAGLSLPTALFQLSRSLPTPFGLALQRFLGGYEKGKSLQECLARFRQDADLRASAASLALLEMAYRNGLAVGPLLEKMLPVMEAEQQSRERVEAMMRASLGQATLAFLLPWALGAFLWLFQPSVVEGFLVSPLFYPVVAASLIIESGGVFLIWKVSRFF